MGWDIGGLAGPASRSWSLGQLNWPLLLPNFTGRRAPSGAAGVGTCWSQTTSDGNWALGRSCRGGAPQKIAAGTSINVYLQIENACKTLGGK